MPIATLRGDLAVPIDQDIPPFWFFNRFNNQLIISSRHLRPSYILKIIEKLEEFTPFLMEAYPSTAYELALYLEQNERYLHIPYIYTGSELLHKHQREMIEQRFKARVMDHYGMAERIAYATECLAGNLHINTDYSYVEIVDDDGNSTDGYGYLVGTTFHNLSMPLIRYKMSDQTKWKKGLCACGKPYPMIEAVTGKLEDVIWGGDGSVVSPSVITFAFKGMTGIRQSQVAQVGNREWEIRIVPMGDFTEWHKQKLVENVRDLVDSSVNVKIKIVPEIARTAAGKYKWVVNEFRNSDINTTT
jgi:phenylacetate-CoA ligase